MPDFIFDIERAPLVLDAQVEISDSIKAGRFMKYLVQQRGWREDAPSAISTQAVGMSFVLQAIRLPINLYIESSSNPRSITKPDMAPIGLLELGCVIENLAASWIKLFGDLVDIAISKLSMKLEQPIQAIPPYAKNVGINGASYIELEARTGLSSLMLGSLVAPFFRHGNGGGR